MQKNLIRKSTHTIAAVFSSNPHRRFHGNRVTLNSHRIKNFKYNGVTCVKCGLRGLYFAKEKHTDSGSYHLNLYGKNTRNKEIMLTQDHIRPRSCGGKNCLHNLQPMCEPCNRRKSNIWNSKQRWYLFKHYIVLFVKQSKISCDCRWLNLILDILY